MQEIDVKKINFQYLSQLLDYKREDFFTTELTRYLTSEEHNPNLILSEISPKGSLLHIAIRNQLLHAVEALIQHGADINATTKTNQSAALIACEVGDWKILDLLLHHPKLHLETTANHVHIPLFCTVVQHLQDRSNLTTDFTKCFFLLINDGRAAVNATDEFGNTALHYAIRNHQERITFELLDRGAFIATNNHRGESPLTHMDPELLEKYMDRCLSEGKCLNAENAGLQFNYKSFLPPTDPPLVPHANEMTAIHRMTENKDLRPLVAHPLIAMFLSVKWSGFALFFNLNLLVYSLFCIGLLMYATLCYIYDDTYNYSLVLWFTVFATYSYVCLITFVNLLLVPQSTARLFRCYIELVLIGLAFMILFVQDQSTATRRIVTGITVGMSGVELLLLIYTIQSQFVVSSLSQVKTFLLSLVHSFVLYCALIVVFSLSFWTNQVHGGGRESNEKQNRDEEMMNNNNKTNNFTTTTTTEPVLLTPHLSPIAGIVKSAVLIMGEFDASKVDLYAHAISYFVIFLFLVFVVIIIFNVFNKFMSCDGHTEAFTSIAENLLIKVYHLHKTEELLGKFRCSYNMTACLPRTLSLPYHFMAKMVRMFSSEASQSVLIVCPVSSCEYTVIIPGRVSNIVVGGDGGGEGGIPPPADHMNKRVQMDRTAYQEAKMSLEHHHRDRVQEQTQEEQVMMMHRLEEKIDVLLERMVAEGEAKQKMTMEVKEKNMKREDEQKLATVSEEK